MSIATEIQRIQTAKNDIKSSIENKGITIENSVKIDDYPTYVDQIPTFDPYNGHEYVEIGGLKWATMNIGASSITDYGQWFQWGDTTGYLSGNVGTSGTTYKKPFNWADYKFGNGKTSPTATGMTKYNENDNKTTLDSYDDAARANWGGSWRMPTSEDYAALRAATTSAWTTDYQGSGVVGLILTDKTDSSKVLFFPATGAISGGTVSEINQIGRYWLSSLNTSNKQNGHVIYATSIEHYEGSRNRFHGISVRPVQVPHQNITITLNTTDGTSASGISVTVTDSDGATHTGTTDSNGQVALSGVANGSATVRATEYIIQTNSSITVSANAKSFTCNCRYTPFGVWAYYSDGTLKSESEADSSAIGVAVITSNCRFVIDKIATNGNNTIQFGGSGKDLSGIGVVLTDNLNTAKLDFDGEGNTTKIINALDGYTDTRSITGAPAAETCKSAFDGQGYLGSVGEWAEAYTNKTSINNMMTKIGGTAIASSGYHWCSTLYTQNQTWAVKWEDGTFINNYRYNSPRARAFRSLE